MSTQTFEALTRRAAARLSRRSSLLTLGGAALAATIATPERGNAKQKKRKQKGSDCKKKEKQRCANDAAACKATIAPLCRPDNPDQCLAVQACCEACSASGVLACFGAVLDSQASSGRTR